MSFAFLVEDDVVEEQPNGRLLRTVLKAQVFEVSIVAFPAYPTTNISVESDRSLYATRREVELEILENEELIG